MSHHGGWGSLSILPDPDLRKRTRRLGGKVSWGGWVSHHRLGLRHHSPGPLCTTLRRVPQEDWPS